MNRHTEKIVIAGGARAGKTSYIALSLSCLFRLSRKQSATYALYTDDGILYLADYPRHMREGDWPQKTDFFYGATFGLSYDNFISRLCWGNWRKGTRSSLLFSLVDLNGDLFSLPDQEGQDCAAALNQAEGARFYMLMVDVCRLLDKDSDQGNVLQGLARMLEVRLRQHQAINLAIVFTKCDMLDPQGYPPKDRKKLLVEAFEEYSPYASRVFAEAVTEYFCVSCLPDESHRKTDMKRGVIANEHWTSEDMRDQLGPWIWFFKKMSFLHGIAW